MAKTQYSFSADPALMGAPKDFTLPVRDGAPVGGRGLRVALAAHIMTMPGLPKIPSAERIGRPMTRARFTGCFKAQPLPVLFSAGSDLSFPHSIHGWSSCHQDR